MMRQMRKGSRRKIDSDGDGGHAHLDLEMLIKLTVRRGPPRTAPPDGGGPR